MVALVAMTGRFDEARTIMAPGRLVFRERGLRMNEAEWLAMAAQVERLDGRPEDEERLLREGIEPLEGIDEKSFITWHQARLARTLADQGHLEEAIVWAGEAEAGTLEDDMTVHPLTLAVHARVRARLGSNR
jgi:ATP/maltotriose-dependent transcriptional regulator MalT